MFFSVRGAGRRTNATDVVRLRTKLEHRPRGSSYLEQFSDSPALHQLGLYVSLASRVASSPFDFSAFFFVESSRTASSSTEGIARDKHTAGQNSRDCIRSTRGHERCACLCQGMTAVCCWLIDFYAAEHRSPAAARAGTVRSAITADGAESPTSAVPDPDRPARFHRGRLGERVDRVAGASTGRHCAPERLGRHFVRAHAHATESAPRAAVRSVWGDAATVPASRRRTARCQLSIQCRCPRSRRRRLPSAGSQLVQSTGFVRSAAAAADATFPASGSSVWSSSCRRILPAPSAAAAAAAAATSIHPPATAPGNVPLADASSVRRAATDARPFRFERLRLATAAGGEHATERVCGSAIGDGLDAIGWEQSGAVDGFFEPEQAELLRFARGRSALQAFGDSA